MLINYKELMANTNNKEILVNQDKGVSESTKSLMFNHYPRSMQRTIINSSHF